MKLGDEVVLDGQTFVIEEFLSLPCKNHPEVVENDEPWEPIDETCLRLRLKGT